jgi:hypothetical protein
MNSMNVSIINTPSQYVNEFRSEYCSTHTNVNEHTLIDLSYMFSLVMQKYDVMSGGYESFNLDNQHGLGDALLEEHKILWLFYNIPLTSFSSQLKSFMVEKNNPRLSDKDYTLLFYASLPIQEQETSFEWVPLDMLYEIFIPLAEENMNKWKTEQKPCSLILTIL